MQDNSFDKHIEQQLHDINIEPSVHVWTAVEKELDKRKRNFPFFWWLLPLLLIGFGLIIFISNNETPRNEVVKTKDSLITTQLKTAGKNDKQVPLQNPLGATEADLRTQTSSVLTPNNFPVTASASTLSESGILLGKTNSAAEAKTVVKAITSKGKQRVIVTPSAAENISMIESTKEQIAVDETTKTVEVSQVSTTSEIIDSVVAEPNTNKKVQNDSTFRISVPKTRNDKKRNDTKWSTEWIAVGGLTQLRTLDFSSTNENLLYTPGNTGSNPLPGANNRVRNQYSFRNGMYLGAGFQLNKKISKTVSLVSGLHYNYQSTDVDKRILIDTATSIGTSTYYTTISNQLYREKLIMHSINIPLLLKYNLIKNFELTTGLYNNLSITSTWNNFSDVLGKHKFYLPSFHFNPSLTINHLSVGPIINIGLRQYNSGQNLVNYGLMLQYRPKK